MRKIILLLVLLLSVAGVGLAQGDILDRNEINTISQSVVYIEAMEDGQTFASGSGTIVEETGLIYTNHHVIEGADELAIFLIEDMRELPVHRYYASIVQDFNEIDFAILQIDRDERGRQIDTDDLNLPFIGVNQLDVSHGDQIHIFGFPDIGDGYLVLTEGTITTIENGDIGGDRLPIWYRTDASMSSGNSGGLVVDSEGRFIGIPTWVRKADSTLTQLGGILPVPAIEAVLKTGNNDRNDPVVTDESTLTLENESDNTICYVYISPTTSTEWGSDFLGSENVMRPGDEQSWELPEDTYDVLLKDCDQEELAEEYGVELSRSVTLSYPDDLSGEEEPTLPTDGELSVEITDVEYDAEDPSGDTNETGIKIYTYIRATGYRNIPLRVGVFFYWEDGTPISGENAHEDNQTPTGGLTHQEVITPQFDDTEWTEYWFWMPYSSFPDGLEGEQDAYVSASVDADGSDELGNISNEWEFTLYYPD